MLAGLFFIALLVTLFGPKREDDDPEPTTYNSDTRGAKAAYLLLPELGYDARRWESPLGDLRNQDAERTTLILAEPLVRQKDLAAARQAVREFLDRGGWVLATGPGGATLLPGGSTIPTHAVDQNLCYTTPQGSGALARAGKVPIPAYVRWEPAGSDYTVEQRCGNDPVVVRFGVGEGEAIWWSSPMPLTNEGLHDDPSLKLTLASMGAPGRTILFDEYQHVWRSSIQDTVAGLPWWPLAWQCVAAGVLLLFSFSRRNGPLRTPLAIPRTSPIEFAESMGQLYAKAGATQAATQAARGRLVEFLREHCGVPREQLRAPALVLTGRFGGDWAEVDDHLRQAEEARDVALAPKSALKLVQSMDADLRRLQGLWVQTRSQSSRAIG
jgi:hypothetical protein